MPLSQASSAYATALSLPLSSNTASCRMGAVILLRDDPYRAGLEFAIVTDHLRQGDKAEQRIAGSDELVSLGNAFTLHEFRQ